MATRIVGVMGPGATATPEECRTAERLGALIANEGWTTLTGGMAAGVMDAALRGASDAGGLTVGVLPGDTAEGASPAAAVRIITGLGEARNAVNTLTSEVLFVCGMSPGTASEVALAIRAARPVVLVGAAPNAVAHWTALGGSHVHATLTAYGARKRPGRVNPRDNVGDGRV